MSHVVGWRELTAAVAISLATATMTMAAPGVATAGVADPPPAVSVVAKGALGTVFGDLQVRDGVVYAYRDSKEIASYPADGSSPDSATDVRQVPVEWHGDGHWQSDREAFVVAPDGSYYLRAPYVDHAAGGGIPHTFGWGIGRLAPDGTVDPPAVPAGGQAYDDLIGGSSESLAMDPSGDGVYLGGSRSRSDGYTYGLVARLPLPAAPDQQTAARIVASADGFDPQRQVETYHPGRSRPATGSTLGPVRSCPRPSPAWR